MINMFILNPQILSGYFKRNSLVFEFQVSLRFIIWLLFFFGMGSVQDKKRKIRCTLLTEETLDNTGHWLKNSPKKSREFPTLPYEEATKLLKLKLYKITVIQYIGVDFVNRFRIKCMMKNILFSDYAKTIDTEVPKHLICSMRYSFMTQKLACGEHLAVTEYVQFF